MRLAPQRDLRLGEMESKASSKLLEEIASYRINVKEDWHFDHSHACDVLMRHFRVHNLDGFGLKGMIAAINACRDNPALRP